jgi:hypothetical protein
MRTEPVNHSTGTYCGGESGIRTRGPSLDSLSYRSHIAHSARNATDAADPCTRLYAGVNYGIDAPSIKLDKTARSDGLRFGAVSPAALPDALFAAASDGPHRSPRPRRSGRLCNSSPGAGISGTWSRIRSTGTSIGAADGGPGQPDEQTLAASAPPETSSEIARRYDNVRKLLGRILGGTRQERCGRSERDMIGSTHA